MSITNNDKPRMLFLDDEQWRHEAVERRLGNIYDIKHINTVSQLKSRIELYEKAYDVISLDHDLGVASIVGTGLQAAQYVADLPRWKQPETVIIHSWNIPAADKMYSVLLAAGLKVWRDPFRAKD